MKIGAEEMPISKIARVSGAISWLLSMTLCICIVMSQYQPVWVVLALATLITAVGSMISISFGKGDSDLLKLPEKK